MKPEKKVKVKEEAIGAADTLNQVFAVQKPYSGCQLTSLVKPIDPLKGLEGSEIVPDKVHGVYPTKDVADKVAGEIFLEYQKQEQALEEKKGVTVEKIKKAMDELEKQRKQHVDMIKENPKDTQKHRGKVAELTHKIDELVGTMERIEKSKKNLDEKEKVEKVKKELKEALSKKAKLSSKEYQAEKKKEGFKASDWEWNKEEQLYKIKKDLKEALHEGLLDNMFNKFKMLVQSAKEWAGKKGIQFKVRRPTDEEYDIASSVLSSVDAIGVDRVTGNIYAYDGKTQHEYILSSNGKILSKVEGFGL